MTPPGKIFRETIQPIEQGLTLAEGLDQRFEINGFLGVFLVIMALAAMMSQSKGIVQSVVDRMPNFGGSEKRDRLRELEERLAAIELGSLTVPQGGQPSLPDIGQIVTDMSTAMDNLPIPSELDRSKRRAAEREVIAALVKLMQAPGLCVFVKEFRPEELGFTMIAVNDVYATTYLDAPADSYKGRPDAEIWGAETARSFLQKDLACIQSPDARMEVREVILTSLSGRTGIYEGYKIGHVMPSGMQIMLSVGVHNPA